MPALIRAGAVGPPVKQAKSGGAGLRARLPFGGTGFQPCAALARCRCHQNFRKQQLLMGLRPTHKL